MHMQQEQQCKLRAGAGERQEGTHHVPFSRSCEFYDTGGSLVTRWLPSDDFSETAFNVACSRNIKMRRAVTSRAVTLEIVYCNAFHDSSSHIFVQNESTTLG
jgi:hypothetical protein